MFKTVPSLSLLYFLDFSFKSYDVCTVKPRIIVSRDISWDGCGIFCPLMQCWFLWVGITEAKNSTLGGKEPNVLSQYGFCTGCPANLMWRASYDYTSIMPNGASTFWSFFPCRTDELDAVNKLNERNSAWEDNFVNFCETAGNSYWRGLAIKFLHEAKIALYNLVDELTVNPARVDGQIGFENFTDTCGRGKFWIRKEKFADSKISRFVWTGRQCSVRRRWTLRFDGLALCLLCN